MLNHVAIHELSQRFANYEAKRKANRPPLNVLEIVSKGDGWFGVRDAKAGYLFNIFLGTKSEHLPEFQKMLGLACKGFNLTLLESITPSN